MHRSSSECTYDALGRIKSVTPSGSNHVMKAVEHTNQEVTKTTLLPGELRPMILNAPKLFTPLLSKTNPPVQRSRTLASIIGYSSFRR